MKKLLPFIMLLFSTQSFAEEDFHWRTNDGSIAQNTKNQKSINSFGGWLLVTPDEDWEEKWNTPRENVPVFSEAEEVEIGEVLTILPFFANPRFNKNSEFNVMCDIKIQRPDGTFSFDKKELLCAQGKLDVDPMTIFLTRTIIKYIGEEDDPFGKWTIYFKMTDTLRGVSIPLETSFTLVKSKSNKSQPSTTKSGI